LRLSDDDYINIVSSFDDLPSSDLDDVMGLSIKQLGRHLHIIRSISILEQLCTWKPDDLPLDYFLHIGGTPMINVGNILIRDDVQYTLTQLLEHIGSPSLKSISTRSRKSRKSSSDHSSFGSRTGTHISFPNSLQVQMVITSHPIPDPPSDSLESPAPIPISPPSPIMQQSSTILQDIPEDIPDTAIMTMSAPTVSKPVTRSA